MKLACLSQGSEEPRAALVPDLVAKFQELGFEVAVEKSAGAAAGFTDQTYQDAGALCAAREEVLPDADLVLTVRPPQADAVQQMKKGGVLVGALEPFGDQERLRSYAAAGLSAFAMEWLPRISRAQSMDVLSSQSNLAGYKAVIDAAAMFSRAMPMMMTAAGTIAPARVFVMGVGVAGLQAVATAKRLGAIISATDIRPVAKEQVESLGGSFVMVEDEESAQAETAGGYAKEMSEDYRRRQQLLIEETIAAQDIVICTALIPGRPAPKLVSAEMVRSMKPGSLIIDLAAEQGGNCELSKPGEVVEENGVRIVAHKNMPGRLAKDASTLYARNLLHFVSAMVDEEAKTLAIDWDDEIFTATALTKEGKIFERSAS